MSVRRIEYAVRYDAPVMYAGLVTSVHPDRGLAERIARAEEDHPGAGFKCTVMERTVEIGDWVESPPSAPVGVTEETKKGTNE